MDDYIKTRKPPEHDIIVESSGDLPLAVPKPPPAVLPTPIEKQDEPANLEDAFQSIFGTSKSGTGEEELLRIASQFSLQISAPQMKLLIYLMHRAEREQARGGYHTEEARLMRMFVIKWLEYKQNNNSDVFVMKALEHISLRHYINENSFKVNIEK